MHFFQITLFLARFWELRIAEMRNDGPGPLSDHLVQPRSLDNVGPPVPPYARSVVPVLSPPRTIAHAETTSLSHPSHPGRLGRTPIGIRTMTRPVSAVLGSIIVLVVIDHAARICRTSIIAFGSGYELPQIALYSDHADGFRHSPIPRSDDLVIFIPTLAI